MELSSGIILGLVQGLTEFIPVSSSGHLIIARELFGLSTIDGLAVDAVLQLATIFAVLVYFWSDLLKLALSAFRFVIRQPVEEKDKIMLLAVAAGTIPGVTAGVFLESYMETAFRSAFLVACMLIVGSVLFVIAEKYASNSKPLSVKNGFLIGLFQCLALVPGMSRSGATISGGLLLGLERQEAIRFSFILSFPIILGSGLKKFFDLFGSGELYSLGVPLFTASAVAFVVGLASIHFLVRFLKNHQLTFFVYYRVALAVFVFLFLLI
jgi:undecaprenyl-diphosphatase